MIFSPGFAARSITPVTLAVNMYLEGLPSILATPPGGSCFRRRIARTF